MPQVRDESLLQKLLKFEKLFLIFNNGQIEVVCLLLKIFVYERGRIYSNEKFELIEKANISCKYNIA